MLEINVEFDRLSLMVSINGINVLCLKDITWDCSCNGVTPYNFDRCVVTKYEGAWRLSLYREHNLNIIFIFCSRKDSGLFPYGASVWNEDKKKYITIEI